MKIITRNEVIDTAAVGSVRLQNRNARTFAAGKSVVVTEYRIELRDMAMKEIGYIDFRTAADRAEETFERIREAVTDGDTGTVKADEYMMIRTIDPSQRPFGTRRDEIHTTQKEKEEQHEQE